MTAMAPTLKHTFTERAAADNLNDAQIINSNNPDGPDLPSESDVIVGGGGIHGLIYAIHSAKYKPGNLKISLIEKNNKPGYKIGESTVPHFALWTRMNGLTGEYLLRLFGLKDGFGFYIMDREKQGEYSDFCSNGVPGIWLNTFHVERQISELLLTLYAQRHGVNVYHGRQIDFGGTSVKGGVKNSRIEIAKGKSDGAPATRIDTSLLVDATGRFRQLASKSAPNHRFEGWNYDAFWGYFTCPTDESNMPFRFYEGANTNHLCFPEGWAWIIRLPSWEGNPIPNLMDMISYLLDCAEAKTPGDEIGSTNELAERFGLKVRWVTSIGFAVRNDVKYPDDMSAYGTKEAERKFNYFVEKYSLLKEFMSNFELINDLYGPGTTWYIRKTLTYQSPVVSGPGWLAVGDACGFTNPLYSPGIGAAMATSTYAAELTHHAIDEAKVSSNADAAELSIRKTFAPYDDFASRVYPALNLMNKFNYCCFRSPRLGPELGNIWTFFVGLGVPGWQPIRTGYATTYDTYVDYSTNWVWGAMLPEFDAVAKKTIELLAPIPLEDPVPESVVNEAIEFGNNIKKAAVESHRYNFRWDGVLRYYDGDANYDINKTGKDRYVRQCKKCASWLLLRPDWRKCVTCGEERTAEEAAIVWEPALPPGKLEALETLVSVSDDKPGVDASDSPANKRDHVVGTSRYATLPKEIAA